MSNNANRYSEEFKTDAIRLVKEGNRSIPSVAKDLGINPQTLRNWLGEEKKQQDPDSARILELEAELRAEKRRNAELEETVTILKKATALRNKQQPEIVYQHIRKLSSIFRLRRCANTLKYHGAATITGKTEDQVNGHLKMRESLRPPGKATMNAAACVD